MNAPSKYHIWLWIFTFALCAAVIAGAIFIRVSGGFEPNKPSKPKGLRIEGEQVHFRAEPVTPRPLQDETGSGDVSFDRSPYPSPTP